MFCAYWIEPDGSRVNLDTEGKLSDAMQAKCEARMKTLLSRCSFDHNSGAPKKDGSEYFAVRSNSGQVNVCRKWVEWQGDWRNWLDVCFDADSGELYYFYLSSECLSDFSAYRGLLPAQFGPAYVAEVLGDELGYELLYLDVPEGDPNSIIASYACGGSALRLNISCMYHESMLLDVKISCVM